MYAGFCKKAGLFACFSLAVIFHSTRGVAYNVESAGNVSLFNQAAGPLLASGRAVSAGECRGYGGFGKCPALVPKGTAQGQ
jgi:hypothetical protein